MLKGNQLTSEIISSAIEVHRNLAPGLLESTYEECMAYELQERKLKVERQLARISHRLGHNRNFDQAARLQPDEVV